MNFKRIIPLAVLTLISSLAGAADISGKWKSEFDSAVGHQKYTFDLKQDGDKLTGKAHREVDGQKTETKIKEAKLDGDAVQFVETLKRDDQDIRIEYRGKVAGNELKLTRKVGDFATMEIVAKREAVTAASILGGQWKAEFDTQIGPQKYLFTFTEENGVLASGVANAEIGGQKYETKLRDGKLNGTQVFFIEPLKFQETELRIEYSGTVSGDEMKLARKVGDVATEQLVVHRVKAGAAAPTKGITLKVVRVDSEETAGENARGSNAVDGDQWTIWHTQWQDESPSHPHEIVIELTPPSRVKGFTYLPRQDEQSNGTIKRYEFYISDSDKEFGDAVKRGEFSDGREKQTITFEPKAGRYVRLRARSEINGQPWASAAEIGVITE